ncbi:YtxH domain-containing protein [bacterium]|nr:YtxH domain-containing protein [bacterium]
MKRKNEEGKEYSSKPLKVLAGILIGFLVGAVTMLFLAPKSGKDTRVDIQTKGNELRDQTTDMVEDTVTHVRSKMNKFAQDSREMMNDFRPNGQEFTLEQFGYRSEAAKNEK